MPLNEALAGIGVLPDFAGPYGYTHRKSGDVDIYFINGTGDKECTFRIQGRKPELWCPVTGRTRDAGLWHETGDGRTTVPISLPGNGSLFVVFQKAARKSLLASFSARQGGLVIEGRGEAGVRLNMWKNGLFSLTTADGRRIGFDSIELPSAITLPGPWPVRFAPGWGAPESAIFGELVPWNLHADDGIKHFSGTATYHQTFRLDDVHVQAGRLVRLQLGTVQHIARVRLNGRDLGPVWTEPWTIDLTGAVRIGENKLEIGVTNVWINRLIGDAALPPEKRLTKTNVPLCPDK
jgi:hypothetical protein